MGINYGQQRPRLEELKSLPGPTLASLGDEDIEFDIYDYQQVADEINEQLDKTQAAYNERYNFPPS